MAGFDFDIDTLNFQILNTAEDPEDDYGLNDLEDDEYLEDDFDPDLFESDITDFEEDEDLDLEDLFEPGSEDLDLDDDLVDFDDEF